MANEAEKEKKSAEQRFTDDFISEVIEAVKVNEAPWQKLWQSGAISAPYNAQSGNLYSGRNALRLALKAERAGYQDPRWATAYQINQMHGRITKGEKGTGILFFSQKTEKDQETGEKKPKKSSNIRLCLILSKAICQGLRAQICAKQALILRLLHGLSNIISPKSNKESQRIARVMTPFICLKKGNLKMMPAITAPSCMKCHTGLVMKTASIVT